MSFAKFQADDQKDDEKMRNKTGDDENTESNRNLTNKKLSQTSTPSRPRIDL